MVQHREGDVMHPAARPFASMITLVFKGIIVRVDGQSFGGIRAFGIKNGHLPRFGTSIPAHG